MFEKMVKTLTYVCLAVGAYQVAKITTNLVEETREKVKCRKNKES